MHSCEGTGKNIEQAIQNALLELKASREDVDIKILSEGGFLKKAKVLVTISQDALEKYEKKESLKKVLEKDDEDFSEDYMAKKIEKSDKAEKKVRVFADEEISDKISKEEKKEEKKQEKNLLKQEKKQEKLEEKQEKKEDEGFERKFLPREFAEKILKILDIEGEVELSEEDRFLHVNIQGEQARELIGHHGECMFALSHMMNLTCQTPDKKKIVLDIGDYRQKRAESLTALAKRVADKVAKTGRYQKLEPMDASERKVIHTALQDDSRVTTLSKGQEPKRYLIVFPKEYDEK